MGQSEFAVIAPATGTDGALRLVRRLGGTIESSPIPVRGGERSLRVQAGYCAVTDFAESTVDAVELLLRATTALRDLKRGGDSEKVRGFDQTSVSYPS
jgi:GGDEF domain-containing protein